MLMLVIDSEVRHSGIDPSANREHRAQGENDEATRLRDYYGAAGIEGSEPGLA
jgi:hypothetical protein